MSTISDKIGLDVDIINIWFKYSDTDTVSDVEYLDSDTGRSEPSKRIWSRIRSENIYVVFHPWSHLTNIYIIKNKKCNQIEELYHFHPSCLIHSQIFLKKNLQNSNTYNLSTMAPHRLDLINLGGGNYGTFFLSIFNNFVFVVCILIIYQNYWNEVSNSFIFVFCNLGNLAIEGENLT